MKQGFLFSNSTFALILSGLIIFSSCKKNNITNSNDPNPSLTVDAAQSDAVSDAQFDDVFNITMGVQTSDVGENIGLCTGSGIIYRTTNADKTKSTDSTGR